MTKSGKRCVRWTSAPDYQNIDLTVKSIFQMNTWLINSKYCADSDGRLHGGCAHVSFYTSLRPVVCLNSSIEGTIQDDVIINDGIN